MIYDQHDGRTIVPISYVPIRTGLPGRPRIHPDRKAYKAQKERERRQRRAALKEAKP